MDNKVSVIISHFNQPDFCLQAVESLDQQDRQPDEIIIVDDCSSDNNFNKLKKLLKGKGVQIFQTPVNGGPSIAKNLGIEKSTGDIIAFLDQDDLYYPQKISSSLQKLNEHPSIGLVYTDYDQLFVDTGKTIREYKHPYDVRLLWQVCIVSTNSIVKKEVFNRSGLFDPRFRVAEDYHLWLRISRHYMIYHIPESLFCYRMHSSNLTTNVNIDEFNRNIQIFKKELSGG